MSTVVLAHVDHVFPVGTTCNRIARAGKGKLGGRPRTPSLGSAVVAADGSLTFTGCVAGVPYSARGVVGGTNRYLDFADDTFVAATKWRDKVKARRIAIGTTLPGAP